MGSHAPDGLFTFTAKKNIIQPRGFRNRLKGLFI
jgi:hypothetical protein